MKTIVEKHFDDVAGGYDKGKRKYNLYYSSLKKILKKYIPVNSRVCEIGCGTGELLVSVKPSQGWGMDISSRMVDIASNKYLKNKNVRFSTKFPQKNYDYIFMCDVIEHLENPHKTFKNIRKIMNRNSIFINTMANPIWEPLLMVWEKLGLKMKEGPHKRISYEELQKIMNEGGLKITEHGYVLLMPIYIPFITELINRYIEPMLKRLSFIEYVVAVKV